MAITALESRMARNAAFNIDSEHAQLALNEYKANHDLDAFAKRLRLPEGIAPEQIDNLNITIIIHALSEFYKSQDRPEPVFVSENRGYISAFHHQLQDVAKSYQQAIHLIAFNASNSQLTQYMKTSGFRCRDWMRLRSIFSDEIDEIRSRHSFCSGNNGKGSYKPELLTPLQKKKIIERFNRLKVASESEIDNVIDLCIHTGVNIAQLTQLELS